MRHRSYRSRKSKNFQAAVFSSKASPQCSNKSLPRFRRVLMHAQNRRPSVCFRPLSICHVLTYMILTSSPLRSFKCSNSKSFVPSNMKKSSIWKTRLLCLSNHTPQSAQNSGAQLAIRSTLYHRVCRACKSDAHSTPPGFASNSWRRQVDLWRRVQGEPSTTFTT